MHLTIGRTPRLAALGVVLITAAAVSISSSGSALADTADTGGTATISLTGAFLVHLAKSNVLVLPGAPATSSFTSGLATNRFARGHDGYTLPVIGGDGEVNIFTGRVDFGGTLVLVNAKAGRTVTITKVKLNFFNGALTGILPGSTKATPLAFFGGNMSTDTSAGPPATESFRAGQVRLSGPAAKALNADLDTTAFTKGTDIGAFATTFDVTLT